MTRRRGYLPDGRRTLTHRSLVRYLRLALLRGDEAEATRYAFELAGYLGRLGRHHALDALETFRASARTLALVLTLILITRAAPARAAGADEAAAVVLFREAKQLVAAEHYAEACPKFAESQRLGPSSGTLLSLADCYEKLGKLATAWGTFQEARLNARNSGDTGRETEAVRRAGLLEPRLSKLSIVVPPVVRAVAGLRVTRDGETVGEGQWGSAIPLDPGEHALEASAPGRRTWTKKFTIAGPGATTVEVEPLAPGPVDVKPETLAAPYWNGQRIAGVIIGGAGLAGVVIGSVFGVQSANKNSASMAYCPSTPTMCYAPGVALRNDAYSVATASTIAVIAGGVGVAAGAITFFTATKVTPTPKGIGLAVGPRALAVEGSW